MSALHLGTVMKVILACDESGAKGYADQDEQYPGEVGVFAGLFVSDEALQRAEQALEAVIAPHRESDGKLHVTDLKPEAQASLRSGIYKAILDQKLPCFWYAIHVAGFHAFHSDMQQIASGAREQLKIVNLTPRVKGRSPREHPESLHASLFTGLYGHIVAFIEERKPGPVEIDVRTDRVDAPIAKLFRQKAEDLLSVGPKTYPATGYDTIDQRVVKGEIRSQIQYPPELEIVTRVDKLTVTSVGDEDPLVVAADVLANSLLHHFRKRSGDALYADLNRPSAILGHPLEEALHSFRNWGGADMSDRMYRHPKAPTLNKEVLD